jgi:hypothetical protein
MTTIAGLPRRSADLASRWSSAGCDDTPPNAPCRHQSKLATATLNDRLNHQPKLLLPTSRVFARTKAHRAPSHPPSASAKSP